MKLLQKMSFVGIVATTLMATGPLAFAKKGGEKLDIEMREWNITTSAETIAAGDVEIKVKNKGKETHELVFLKLNTDLATGRLPVDKDGAIDEAKMNFGTIVHEVEGLESGKSAKNTINLKPGRYAIICNVLEQEPTGEMEAHYSMGMHTVLNVE